MPENDALESADDRKAGLKVSADLQVQRSVGEEQRTSENTDQGWELTLRRRPRVGRKTEIRKDVRSQSRLGVIAVVGLSSILLLGYCVKAPSSSGDPMSPELVEPTKRKDPDALESKIGGKFLSTDGEILEGDSDRTLPLEVEQDIERRKENIDSREQPKKNGDLPGVRQDAEYGNIVTKEKGKADLNSVETKNGVPVDQRIRTKDIEVAGESELKIGTVNAK